MRARRRHSRGSRGAKAREGPVNAHVVIQQEEAAPDRIRGTAWLHGVVTDGASGDDVQGVVVELWSFVEHAPHFVATTTSDGAGQFVFEAPTGEASDPNYGYELRVLQAD